MALFSRHHFAAHIPAVVLLTSLVTVGHVVEHAPMVAGQQEVSACPAGYDLKDPVEIAREFGPVDTERAEALHERYGSRFCAWRKLPEPLAEIGESQESRAESIGNVPAGLMRKAIEQKAAMQAQPKAVSNAVGKWSEYGAGPQIYDATYINSSGNDGIYTVNGRVDKFVYDDVNKRLFAGVGNGGVWMSTPTGTDLSTLGDHWTNVGNGLPTQVASGLAWTPAGGGTLIVITGEHTQGGNSYVGLGAYWSSDLGKTWNHANGVPDGAFAFYAAVDGSNPSIVYAATGKGLYRSTDAGRSYVNTRLPVSADCAGDTTKPKCGFANFVTGLLVKAPGGFTNVTCNAKGCPVIAAVGYRAGALPYADGTPQSPGNGLYRSDTGEPGTFVKIEAAGPSPLQPQGFAPQDRIGRVEMGAAYGPAQDHNIIYAVVQDARLFNGNGGVLLDSDAIPGGQLPIDCSQIPPTDIDDEDVQFVCTTVNQKRTPTYLNGIYVSTNFGTSWIRMADDAELLASCPENGSSLCATSALNVGPGIQSWYNQWISVDPTTADPTGVPLRIAFGLEEVWTNTTPGPQNGITQAAGTQDFKVIGTYFAGRTCQFLVGNVGGVGTPACPTSSTQVSQNRTTVHPDQHAGLFIPDGSGGVYLFSGGDGGAYRQRSTNIVTDPLTNDDWGTGINADRYTLMNYGIAVAKDGTVWYGLQDNTSGKIDPVTRKQIRIYVGDGVWTSVDPNDSKIAYFQTPNLSMRKTSDGGVSNASVLSGSDAGSVVGTPQFLSPFEMDPSDAKHLVAAGTKVAETLDGAATWTSVYDLGVNASANNAAFQVRTRPLDVQGNFVYAGSCAPCNLVGSGLQFRNKISTNVGGAKPANKGTSDGWHDAKMAGLPNRFIYSIHIDREDPTGKTIYVALGGYSTARWATVGQFGDANTNVQAGKNVWVSKDAGESFTPIQGNLPDVVTTYILKRRNQLIVGTDIGVFISSDLAGTEWAPLGDLPNVPVNQLVLRPGNDTQLFAGTFGRGVQLYDFNAASSGGGNNGNPGGGNASPPAIGPAPTTTTTVRNTGRFGGGALGLPLLGMLMLFGWAGRRSRPR